MSKYTVCLADDERMIREGIATLIPWEQLDLQFIGSASNGLLAYHQIAELRPDIVITDIKMPEMNGLELIKLTLERFPDTQFIVLSGFNEFEFASQAMQYGIKHYLLKPCNEVEIIQVLHKVVTELDQTRSKRSYMVDIEGQLAEVLPIKQEQLILDFLLNPISNRTKQELFKDTLQMKYEQLRIILIELTKGYEQEQAQALYGMIGKWNDHCRVLFGKAIEDKFVLMVEEAPRMDLSRLSMIIKNEYLSDSNVQVNFVISESCRIEDVGETYHDALEKLRYRNYFGQSSVFTKEIGVKLSSGGSEQLNLLVDQIVTSIKLGDIESLMERLTLFFDKLRDMREEIHLTIGYCIELITEIIRKTDLDPANTRIQQIAPILEMKSLEEFHHYVRDVCLERTKEAKLIRADKNQLLVQRMVELIDEHLSDKELSLQWLAKDIFYLNVDYLGKLFRKEMNEKFSQYVTRVRIERAMELILADAECKLYEVAEQSGFGDDAQYFSNVFKKQTGVSPSEYKRKRT